MMTTPTSQPEPLVASLPQVLHALSETFPNPGTPAEEKILAVLRRAARLSPTKVDDLFSLLNLDEKRRSVETTFAYAVYKILPQQEAQRQVFLFIREKMGARAANKLLQTLVKGSSQ